MEQLPPHVATADEPIEVLRDDPWAGPDMRNAMPIAQMIEALRKASDRQTYLELWRGMIESVGGSISVMITREGAKELGLGTPCDSQIRHRSRWLHFLVEDMKRDPSRRAILVAQMIAEGRYADNRPAEPSRITRAVRDFLISGGRILIEPDGRLTEGGGIPRSFTSGSERDAEECVRASKAYFAVRRRWRSERHIKRAVRMLGSRTSNGWLVLEARA